MVTVDSVVVGTSTLSPVDDGFLIVVVDINFILVEIVVCAFVAVSLVIFKAVVEAATGVAAVVLLGEALTGFVFVVLVGVSLIAGSVTISFFIGDFSVVVLTSEELLAAAFESTGVSVT